MADGVQIAAFLYEPTEPAPSQGWPAVMVFHGLGGSRHSVEFESTALATRGYVVLAPDARGQGDSGGLFSLGGPAEVGDVRAEFDWLAALPDVDAAHIGGWGASYGGGVLLNAAVAGVPFAALEPMITWSDLGRALAPQSLVKSGAVFQFARAVAFDRFPPDLATLIQQGLANRNVRGIRSYLAQRSSLGKLGTLTTPTLLVQGRRDFIFDMAQATQAFARLRGPKRLYIGPFGHAPSTFPGPDVDHLTELAGLWFDRFLKGDLNGVDTGPPVELAPDPWTGTTVRYQTLPPGRTLRFTLARRGRIGIPTGKLVRTFTLPSRRLEEFGAPVVRLRASTRTSWAHVVAVLSVREPTGHELVLSEGGAETSFARRPRTVAIRLLSTATLIPPGSRLRLTLAGTSLAQDASNLLYLTGVPDGSTLDLRRVSVSLPVLSRPISR